MTKKSRTELEMQLGQERYHAKYLENTFKPIPKKLKDKIARLEAKLREKK